MSHATAPPAAITPATDAVLLINLGTPSAPTAAAVRRYLAQFLHDRRVVDLSRWLWCPLLHGLILPLRGPRVARKYAAIWTAAGSPLLAHSQRLAAAVQAALPQARVALAMTYGEPSIAAALAALHAAGVRRLTVLPLYPQFSHTTTSAARDAVERALAASGWRPQLAFIDDYHRDEAWLDAVAQSIQTQWYLYGRGEKLLLSFHGIPQRLAQAGDPYPDQCRASAAAIAQRLQLRADDWQLTFQSRFGREPWLQPYTDQTLQQLARAGVRRVDVVCPGFAVDCLETLEEISLLNARVFRAAGGEALSYIPALNAAPAHAQALAALAQRHADAAPGAAA